MKKFKIEITKDELIRFYANKVVEDGIRDCWEFSNIININDYGENVAKFKNLILERIYRDERVADVNLDKAGNFDMIFYTDMSEYSKKLPEQQRVILQGILTGKDDKEIAAELNISVKAVEYHITKSLKILRIVLKDYFPIWLLYF